MTDPARRRRPPGPRRSRVLLPTLVVLGVLLALFGWFTDFYTDVLWFRSVGFTEVFKTRLLTEALLFLVFGLIMAAAVGASIWLAYRLRPVFRGVSLEQQNLDRYRVAIDPYRRGVLLGLSGLVGLFAGLSASGQWRTWLQWRNAQPFKVTDPQFHKDISFFAFSLPFWRFLLGFAFAVVVLSLLAAAVTHYLYGGLRLQTPGERATPAAQAHLSVLLGAFVLLKAVAYWLDRYSFAVASGDLVDGWTGLRYTDVTALLPVKTVLTFIALICAALFFANVVRRTWLLPGMGLGLLVLSAILLGGVYPGLVQQFRVKPSEADREKPYIGRNIAATRAAYGVKDVKVDQYDATSKASPDQLRTDAETTTSIRVLDPALVSPTFNQLQQNKGYYGFPQPLDVDRYEINGQTQDAVVAVRELNQDGVPQLNWINSHLQYTHGYGFVAARGNTADADGRPSFFESDIPPVGALKVTQPRIYFGEQSPSYSIVGAPAGAPARELDYPSQSATGQASNTYHGSGGVPIGSFFSKLLYAVKLREEKVLLSSGINSASRILYIRRPLDRVEKVAPWLTLDGDPYPAVVGGRIQWIIDGYTTSNGYPNSSRSTLGDVTTDALTTTQRAVVAPRDQVNYIRNSVKAVVDAYDGTVTLYQWDKADPVLQTWMKAFPGTVQAYESIPADLLPHLRYPEDLFKVQRDIMSRYHVTDAAAFYTRQDFWKIPGDPTTETGLSDQPPYYLTVKMPGQSQPTFSLTTTYVPNNRDNLASFMAVNADPGADYGTMRVLELPKATTVQGPKQVFNAFESNPTVSSRLSLLRRGGSDVKLGNLLTLPVGGGLLYVEPVYVQATNGGYPLLQKVLASFGDKIAFENTLPQALNKLFQGTTGQPGTGTGGTGTGSGGNGGTGTGGGGTTTPALRQALADAQAALADAQRALAANDFAAYGAAQKRLADAISRAVAAERKAPPAPKKPSGG